MKQNRILLLVFLFISVSSYGQEIVLKGKQLFGNINARQIGPALMSGRISDLENHPTNDRIVYAGTAGGGVWKSSNGGASFTPIFDDYCQSIGAVALDPNDPDKTIWVGTGEVWVRNSVSTGNGLYRSKDGGVNWTSLPGFENSERISGIEIDPKNSDIVYVGVLGALYNDSQDRGVYKTTDGGATWNKVLSGGPSTGCADIIMDPNNSNVLYASMWDFRRTGWSFSSGGENSALYKSTDGGANWEKIHNGFPKGDLGRFAIAVAPSNSNILYTVVESEKKEANGLYRSDDAGKSWTHLNKDFGLVVRPFYFSRLVVDPRNPDVVVKGGLFGSISRDGGKTFRDLGGMHADIHDIVFDIHNSDRMYVGTDGGVYRTWDGAVTMEMVANLPVSQFYHISVDNEEPYNVYGGLQDNGSWYGPSSSPGGIEARDWNVVGVGDGFRVLRHAEKPIIYSEMQGAENVWRYDIDRNQSKSIQPLPEQGDPKLRFNWNAPIALSPNKADRLYIGSQFVHRSEDMGDTWVKISPDLTTNDPSKQQQKESGGLSVDNSGAENHCTIFTIAESALNQDVIWVGTDDGNVQVTKDGGKNWTNTTPNIEGLPKNIWVYHIEASAHKEGTAYAVFDGHTMGLMQPYVYKTTDYGQSWTSIVTDEIQGFTRSFQEDYVNENLLFVGTELGLYVSINGGKNWSKFTNNMPAVAVHYLEIQKKTNDLVMGTHGRGIIILDDISPLRDLTQEVLNKKVHFFPSQPTIIREESGFGGTATEREYVGPNPTSSAKVIYYLKKRHTFGKMTMEVQDLEGNTLTELSPGKSKGLNVVTWNYRTKQPKMAKGKTFTFGGFTSPRAKAGTYKVVMKKGKETYETSLVLVNDPSSLLTDAERDDLFDTTKKLYDVSEELAVFVNEIDLWLVKSDEVAQVSASGKKVASPFSKKLNALKETLVITTGDNYVGAAEPQLREKLADLYSKIAQGYLPPSAAERANMELLMARFEKAKTDYAAIKKKEGGKLEKFMGKNQIEAPVIPTFDQFIKGE